MEVWNTDTSTYVNHDEKNPEKDNKSGKLPQIIETSGERAVELKKRLSVTVT